MKLFLKITTFILLSLLSCKKSKTTKAETSDIEEKLVETKNLPDEKKVEAIKEYHREIDAQQLGLESSIKKVDEGNFAETEIVVYRKDSLPVKIIRKEIFAHGTRNTLFYIKDKNLFYVKQRISNEQSVDGPFIEEEFNYYFYDNEIIKVLRKQKEFATADLIKMDTVPNVDITEEMNKDKSRIDEITSTYNKTLRIIE